ncbi:hypothetical protein PMAYCL1PPCAC_09592 [Pristionchus mayeri]|uniref:Uncharacterized protein n=1 Tax=Pristionchus mayeri TaxID=1317129 RepID=A0AAN4ZDY1_9BILA|nr:hypothetical protein PMAYCL1PPCAC_09591 [Pristionchus mayeri]GMR39397.1 hypothetical protein PMAYCL1PPCAC_09592 [Pristionchus mayeri]
MLRCLLVSAFVCFNFWLVFLHISAPKHFPDLVRWPLCNSIIKCLCVATLSVFFLIVIVFLREQCSRQEIFRIFVIFAPCREHSNEDAYNGVDSADQLNRQWFPKFHRVRLVLPKRK